MSVGPVVVLEVSGSDPVSYRMFFQFSADHASAENWLGYIGSDRIDQI